MKTLTLFNNEAFSLFQGASGANIHQDNPIFIPLFFFLCSWLSSSLFFKWLFSCTCSSLLTWTNKCFATVMLMARLDYSYCAKHFLKFGFMCFWSLVLAMPDTSSFYYSVKKWASERKLTHNYGMFRLLRIFKHKRRNRELKIKRAHLFSSFLFLSLIQDMLTWL